MPKSESISEHVVRFFSLFGEGENAEDILTFKIIASLVFVHSTMPR